MPGFASLDNSVDASSAAGLLRHFGGTHLWSTSESHNLMENEGFYSPGTATNKLKSRLTFNLTRDP